VSVFSYFSTSNRTRTVYFNISVPISYPLSESSYTAFFLKLSTLSTGIVDNVVPNWSYLHKTAKQLPRLIYRLIHIIHSSTLSTERTLQSIREVSVGTKWNR